MKITKDFLKFCASRRETAKEVFHRFSREVSAPLLVMPATLCALTISFFPINIGLIAISFVGFLANCFLCLFSFKNKSSIKWPKSLFFYAISLLAVLLVAYSFKSLPFQDSLTYQMWFLVLVVSCGYCLMVAISFLFSWKNYRSTK